MALVLGEILQPLHDEGRFDKLIHSFIVNGSVEWTQNNMARANHMLASHAWFVAGEYIPISAGNFADDYSYYLYEPQPVSDCKFETITDDVLPAVVITAEIEGIGPAVLNRQEMCTSNGVEFDRLFESTANGANGTDMPRYWRRWPAEQNGKQ